MDRRGAALGCLATIALADKIIFRRRLPWILVGLFDHPAHLATAGLVLLNLGPRPPGWAAGFMAGSLLPDLDHVPLAVSRVHPSMDDPRPVTHCLLAVAPVAVLAEVKQDERLRGAAAGMLAHFARDVGVGTGVPLLWPLTRRSWRVPYAVYAAGCALLAARGLQNRFERANLVNGL
ncbi:MAG TPA: metal-dependent hydrolase [Solirubrobacteraceae bacterium]|nr:metal-dependent hydrolase [Solirubrobacteraceae bacterium]